MTFFFYLCVFMSVHESCASQLRDVFKTHVAWSSHVLKLPCLHLLLQKQLPTLLFGKIIGFQERVSWSMRSSQRRLSSSSFLQKLSIKGGMLYVHGALCSFHAILSGCPASRNRSKTKHLSRLGGSRIVASKL